MPKKNALVRFAMVVYSDPAGLRRTALRGSTIEVDETEYTRLEKLGAVVDPDTPLVEAVTETGPVRAPATPDVVGATVVQPLDAGSDTQIGLTAEDVDPEATGREDDPTAPGPIVSMPPVDLTPADVPGAKPAPATRTSRAPRRS